jgi:hypothetical protein
MILADMILAAADQPFAWGTNDCCMWSANVVMAISRDGVDLAAAYRGTYSDQAGAAQVISDATSGGTLENLMVQIAGANELNEYPPAFAWRGDIALFDTDTGPALGIITPQAAAAFVSPDGLVMIPIAQVRRSWRVADEPYVMAGFIEPIEV